MKKQDVRFLMLFVFLLLAGLWRFWHDSLGNPANKAAAIFNRSWSLLVTAVTGLYVWRKRTARRIVESDMAGEQQRPGSSHLNTRCSLLMIVFIEVVVTGQMAY